MTTTPAVGVRSSAYGPRKAPKPGASTFHRGFDIAAPKGTTVVAPEAGIVTVATVNSVRGIYVVIDHGHYSTLHQHLEGNAVRNGQHVTEGQTIGWVGTTGVSTGPHLHTEVHDGATPIDPDPWYKARGVRLGTRTAVLGVSTTAPEDDMPLDQSDIDRIKTEAVFPAVYNLLKEPEIAAVIGEAVWRRQIDGVQAWAWLRDARVIVGQLQTSGADVDEQALAAALAPVITAAVVQSLADDPDTPSLTEAQVQAATERAVRAVLGGLG